MHNFKTNFGRFYRICKDVFEDAADSKGNLQCYSRTPNMTDLEMISLACIMEVLGIDSENLLWSKLKTDYPGLFPNLICRIRFNRRSKRLQNRIMKVQDKISGRLEDQS